MGKFEKQLANAQLKPWAEPRDPDEQPPIGDGLIFEVLTSAGTYRTVDLTRYRDGDLDRGFIGCAELIKSLLPAIRAHIGQRRRTRKSVDVWLAKVLPTLFKFITHLQRQTNSFPITAGAFQNADGQMLKTFVTQLGGSPTDRRKSYTAIHSLLTRARGEGAPVLHWPTFDIAPPRDPHVDVDPRAVKALYHACKRALDDADSHQRQGAKWLAEGVNPTSVPRNTDRPPGQRGGLRQLAWYNHANLAVLARMYIRDRIVGSEEVDVASAKKLHRHPWWSGPPGERWTQLAGASAPSLLEVHAAMLIVSMETGWIDAVSGIDLSEEWYALRRGSEVETLRKTDSVVIFATRPKNSKPLTAIGLAGSRFRTFQIIRRLQGRSAFLRDCLRSRRDVLEASPPSAPRRKEIAEINRRLRSPWLYHNQKGKGVDAVGIGGADSMPHALTRLKDLAIASLSANDRHDKDLISAIEGLRWSDIRDAFAAHIFTKSGGNIFLVKRALDHNSIAVTRDYLRQRRLINERFDAFRKVMQTALTEVSEGRRLDPTILFLASNYHDFDERDRQRLNEFRTRMGMGCRNPTSPDPLLAANHPVGALCAVQRCILCRQGIVFRDAYEGLADRHADLVWLRRHSNPTRWLTSTLSWELEAIELVRDRVFTSQAKDFSRRSSQRLELIAAGKAYVFDEPEIIGIFA